MNAIVTTLLSELDDAALAELARRLAPYLPIATPPAGLLTPAEAARHASVHPETIRRAVRTGALPPAGQVGRSPRLAIADVDAWVASGRSAHPSSPSARGRTTRRRATDVRRPLADAVASHSTSPKGPTA